MSRTTLRRSILRFHSSRVLPPQTGSTISDICRSTRKPRPWTRLPAGHPDANSVDSVSDADANDTLSALTTRGISLREVTADAQLAVHAGQAAQRMSCRVHHGRRLALCFARSTASYISQRLVTLRPKFYSLGIFGITKSDINNLQTDVKAFDVALIAKAPSAEQASAQSLADKFNQDLRLPASALCATLVSSFPRKMFRSDQLTSSESWFDACPRSPLTTKRT
ncbi:hypothetical protein K437DRAFT_256885 [Tilletiaria anomala UBC 951]|uniref:Uncharacterized protein n=1 Tax=Tilletiaria anomala (strain ATCC 24038 / CBS 436.72 / UBC 951) TaxID=1037660 RepID=A0A066W1S6_TILAU|nr:uncharacterized protein K437DRAFT_256885 [Tilletiaria anomala UBC 951]KDN44740.1 hypothetical protein K437DRAFT_256885 [Tilletiaria anomala UBC 951]